MNVSLTEKQKNYIQSQVESGDYQNASELVRDALRLHQLYREKLLADLRNEIAKGWEGPPSTRDVMAILNDKATEYHKREK